MGGRLYDTLHAFCIGHVHMKIGSYGSHYLGVGCHIHAQSAHDITTENGHDAGTHGM